MVPHSGQQWILIACQTTGATAPALSDVSNHPCASSLMERHTGQRGGFVAAEFCIMRAASSACCGDC